MKNSAKLAAAAAVILCLSPPSPANDANTGGFWKEFAARIDFLTEFYANQDARTFANHKNGSYREQYLVSSETFFEAMMISYDTIAHIGMFYMNYLGMGRQSDAILFDPRESHYALTPFFEFRHSDIFYQAGLDHRCFHQIDSHHKRREPTRRDISPYWNQPYIKVSSANYRYKQLRNDYIEKGRDSYLDRLRWSAWAGYFIRKFGDMDATLLSGGHPWGSTAGIDASYSFKRTNSWLFSGRNELVLFADTTGKRYWRGLLGIDADIYNRNTTFGFFIHYNYEFPRELPLYSKDQLFDLGVRWRF
jgi:hypothetical protein